MSTTNTTNSAVATATTDTAHSTAATADTAHSATATAGTASSATTTAGTASSATTTADIPHTNTATADIPRSTADKQVKLREILRNLKSVAIAYSGGVDSTYLLYEAAQVLGDKAIAITANICTVPEGELAQTTEFCEQHNITQIVLDFDLLAVDGFDHNPPNRCYLCKSALFGELVRTAQEAGFANVTEGSNVDDESDYRPGSQAIAELGVKSPLLEAGLTKAEIRELSYAAGLPTWNKPSMACLASRFAYGELIDKPRLEMVESAEEFLFALGLEQVRVRVHGDKDIVVARIEALPEQFDVIMANGLRQEIESRLRALGFDFVALDLGGYKTGKMNVGI